jgi:dihydrofolate reductase
MQRKLSVYNSLSLDGYFTDGTPDLGWAHTKDPEWGAFTRENASGAAELIFGRKTYEMMARFWPTPQARQALPEVAGSMNRMIKNVFSHSLTSVDWENSRLVKGDLAFVPVVLGKGRPLFEGVTTRPRLELTKTRAFQNGKIVAWYAKP